MPAGFRIDSSTRVRLAALIGYALFLALTASVLWGGYISLFLQYRPAEGTISLDFAARWSVFPLSFLVIGLLVYLRPNLFERLSSAAPLVFLLSGGLLLFAATTLSDVAEPLLVLVSFCFAAGSALFFVFWTHEIAAQDEYSYGLVIIVAAGISPVIHFLITLLPALPGMFVELLVVAPFCALLLHYVRIRSEHDQKIYHSYPREQHSVIRAAAHSLWRPVFCIASVGFMVGFVRSLTSADATLLGVFNTISAIALLCSCLILVVIWRLLHYRLNLNIIYRLGFPLAATCFLLLPFLGGDFMLPIVIVSFLLFNVMSALMVITCLQTAQAQSLQPAFVYSLTAGVVYLASSLGSGVGVVSNSTGFGFTQLLVLALALFYVFSVVLFLPQRLRNADGSDEGGGGGRGDGSGEQGEGGEGGTDLVTLRCLKLQERYGLSKRECEVATLIARGRDVPYIASSLIISPNTVRSHSKNIFRKLGIHTKRELIDLVENHGGER